jgi:hypothetical protein
MIDLPTLKTELTDDPNGYGYGVSDPADADLLNEVRGTISIQRDEVPTNEIREAVIANEWDGLTAGKQRDMLFLTAGEFVRPNNANIRAAFRDIFGVGTTTRTNLAAVENGPASRGEELFGRGTRITPSHVADARRS